MPLERVSQGFKDVSMTFQRNPLNDDLIALTNETAIARSIRNIVFTVPGERFFDNDFGSNISRSLFELMDNVSAATIRDEITQSILNYEPRVDLISVKAIPNYETSEFNVTIAYKIVGADVPPQELQFVLQQTR